MHDPATLYGSFANSLRDGDTLALLRAGLIGEGAMIPGPFGAHKLLYADYVASGRPLRQVEDFIATHVLPYYANSHTEASFCGAYMTRMRAHARAEIARLCGADDRFSVIFTGSGATAGINRLVHLLGVAQDARTGERGRPIVFIGPYEHHSNILPWRESGAEVIEIPEADTGGPDLVALERALHETPAGRLRVGAFSIASNVTGIITDADALSALLRRHGVLSVWDYAGGGPYLPVDMKAGTPWEKDAVVLSAHKFVGGPAASGVMVVRNAALRQARPTAPGGGTVRFVSPWGHDYSQSPISREEAGTPNVIGDIRAALAFMVKDAIGEDVMEARHAELRQRALSVWSRNPFLRILGNPRATAHLPFFSFQVRDPDTGAQVHQQLFTRMLSDIYGIQARGGCACAGPYAHRLMGIDQTRSDTLRAAILSGQEIDKPGWVRLNFSVLMDDAKADTLIHAVDTLARRATGFASLYECDTHNARFSARPMPQARIAALSGHAGTEKA